MDEIGLLLVGELARHLLLHAAQIDHAEAQQHLRQVKLDMANTGS